MRSVLGLAASALAGLAAVIASQDGDGDIVPFFVVLTFAGGVAAWAAHPPFEGARRRLAQGIALLWLGAAMWVGFLLAIYVTTWQGSTVDPDGVAQATYVGSPATAFHLLGLYAGAVLVVSLAFGRPRGASAASPPPLTSQVRDA